MAEAAGVLSRLPVRRVQAAADADLDPAVWPASIPAVAHLLAHGLDLGAATVLVGENGSGKSTIVEGLAIAFGLSSEGGARGHRHRTRPTESPLPDHLQLVRGAGASRGGFFLRAETMHGFYTYLEEHDGRQPEKGPFHEMSHGESFLEILAGRFRKPGLYLLDEPESALSFAGCLALVGHLHQIAASGRAQVVVATHSPIVAALPGAEILEVGEWGLRPSTWAELGLVDHWTRFLREPQGYLRHVIDS